MKPRLRELLTDLKAAARIGHPDALAAALDRVRATPDEALPPDDLLPLGRALARLPVKSLRPLLHDPDPAVCGLAAVALAERYLQGLDAIPGDLTPAARHPNPEIRRTLARSLASSAHASPEKLRPLAEKWLAAAGKKAARLQSTGLMLFPACQPSPESIHTLLSPLQREESRAVRAALVECLSALAGRGDAESVLGLLHDWARQPDPNVWVITRALSASWAQEHAARAVAILRRLAANAGPSRAVARAVGRLGDG